METKTIQRKTTDQTSWTTYAVYGLGIGALFGGGYLLYNYMRDRNATIPRGTNPIIPPINSNPVVTAPRPTVPTTQTPSIIPRIFRPTARTPNSVGFPIRQGARGNNVIAIQKALFSLGGQPQAIIRTTSMPRGKFDGRFGPGTVKALNAAGYSSVVSQNDFNRLTGGSNGASTPFAAGTIARQLINAANTRNLFATLQGLQKIKNTKQYKQVSLFFKGIRILGIRVTSLVNALLSVAFVNKELDKAKIRTEFKRMGLQQNARGIWFIPGLSGIDQQQDWTIAITQYPTLVQAEDGSLILPELMPNTVIGYITGQQNGVTSILTQSGETVYAPTSNLSIM